MDVFHLITATMAVLSIGVAGVEISHRRKARNIPEGLGDLGNLANNLPDLLNKLGTIGSGGTGDAGGAGGAGGSDLLNTLKNLVGSSGGTGDTGGLGGLGNLLGTLLGASGGTNVSIDPDMLRKLTELTGGSTGGAIDTSVLTGLISKLDPNTLKGLMGSDGSIDPNKLAELMNKLNSTMTGGSSGLKCHRRTTPASSVQVQNCPATGIVLKCATSRVNISGNIVQMYDCAPAQYCGTAQEGAIVHCCEGDVCNDPKNVDASGAIVESGASGVLVHNVKIMLVSMLLLVVLLY